jgi:hypothetical protein
MGMKSVSSLRVCSSKLRADVRSIMECHYQHKDHVSVKSYALQNLYNFTFRQANFLCLCVLLPCPNNKSKIVLATLKVSS